MTFGWERSRRAVGADLVNPTGLAVEMVEQIAGRTADELQRPSGNRPLSSMIRTAPRWCGPDSRPIDSTPATNDGELLEHAPDREVEGVDLHNRLQGVRMCGEERPSRLKGSIGPSTTTWPLGSSTALLE